jgi:type II secretory pathway predicted ATPase ExeA
MKSKQWSPYGLKWNPFSSDVPIEALWVTPRIERFCWRVENQVRDGGFALVTGDPGLGKSVTMRLLAERLSRPREITVGTMPHPGLRIGDFYRELGDLFNVSLTASNRWGGFKMLREKWLAHIEATLMRPVLLIDEAQEMLTVVLAELRLLSSTDFDSRSILTVVLAGDARLPEKFRDPELLPFGSRIRVRATHEYATRDELLACLTHRLEQAGNPSLMAKELMETLCEHAGGNYRTLFNLAGELLDVAMQREVKRLDEKLFLEVFSPPVTKKPSRTATPTLPMVRR